MASSSARVKGRWIESVLLDLDGTVVQAGAAIPGAVEAVGALRAAGLHVRFVTNTTRRPRAEIVASMAALGFGVRPAECITPPVAAAAWLREQGARRVSLLVAAPTLVDFDGFDVTLPGPGVHPEFVVVGDLGREFSYEVLDRAFRHLMAGARLVALQRNRYWDPGDGLHLDAGPFVVALEYAAGVEATLIGKPSRAFFESALAGLDVPLEQTVMAGDSLMGDVGGIQASGGLGVLVRTGKFRQEALEASDVVPDEVLGSVADLPRWLGI